MNALKSYSLIPLLIAFISVSCQKEPAPPYNVLMICVDDLRPELGCYGNEIIQTPGIDRLASEACVFRNHFVQSAVCGPSRAMLLTGKLTRSWDVWRRLREQDAAPDYPVSLPHLFKQQGYRTACIGKISHQPGGVMDTAQTIHQVPYSWDTAYTATGQWDTPWRAFFAFANGDAHNKKTGHGKDTPHIPYEKADVGDEGYPDGLNAREAIIQLRNLSAGQEPFFLAVGFYKPHLPFNAPAEYWELYEPGEIPPADNDYPPKDTDPYYSVHNSYEVTTHYYWPEGPGNIPGEKARDLKHAYYACVSYIDAQVGKIMDELDRLGLKDNTIVVFWSDHGWHLGEHGMFGKQTNFTIATRSPLMIRVPGQTDGGVVCHSLIETVDVYPTLAGLCTLDNPGDLQGRNMAYLISDPDRPGKPYARSFFNRHDALGKTIFTGRYRIVNWQTAIDSTVLVEVYDHRTDPDENINIAYDQPALTDSLLQVLEQADINVRL